MMSKYKIIDYLWDTLKSYWYLIIYNTNHKTHIMLMNVYIANEKAMRDIAKY